ncbi:MAG: MaoC family dehydratase N-terminal domain-containing protein [Ramlibacter sp.]
MNRLQDIAPDTRLPAQLTGPWSSAHVVRWCAAQQNWDRIHHDAEYARRVAGLAHPVINGALKQNLMVRFLLDSFPHGAWVWQVDYTSLAPDFVGDALQLEGRIADVREEEGKLFASVELDVRNQNAARVTSSGRAVIVAALDGSVIADASGLAENLCPVPLENEPQDARPLEGVPARIAECVGRQLEHIRSCVPVDLGRLRLFADAVGGLSPMHYDQRAGLASVYRSVVAPPWFPTHALSMPPGEKELSSEPTAMGREAVCEVGRDMASLFGMPPEGLRSAGNRARFHSLARLGETVEATSRLASVERLAAEDGRATLLFRTHNEYRTTTGRPLLSEVTSFACRLGTCNQKGKP